MPCFLRNQIDFGDDADHSGDCAGPAQALAGRAALRCPAGPCVGSGLILPDSGPLQASGPELAAGVQEIHPAVRAVFQFPAAESAVHRPPGMRFLAHLLAKMVAGTGQVCTDESNVHCSNTP